MNRNIQTRRSVGGFLFHEEADFDADIENLKGIAEGIRTSTMPPQITIAQAKKLIDLTTRAVNDFQKRASVIINDSGSAFVRPAMRSAAKVVQRDYEDKIQRNLGGIVKAAVSQGKSTVDSFRFNYRDIHGMIMSIAFAYEALKEIDDMKPWFVKLMPSLVVGVVALIGNAVMSTALFSSDLLKQAVRAASTGTAMLIAALKWGSIAGGLYLLYGTLKPKAKR